MPGILHHPGLSAGSCGPWQLVHLQWGLKPKSAIALFHYLDWGLTLLLIWWRKWLQNPPWQPLSLSRNHSDLTHLAIHTKCLYELKLGSSQSACSVQPQETKQQKLKLVSSPHPEGLEWVWNEAHKTQTPFQNPYYQKITSFHICSYWPPIHCPQRAGNSFSKTSGGSPSQTIENRLDPASSLANLALPP